jgi:hypothetical protein
LAKFPCSQCAAARENPVTRNANNRNPPGINAFPCIHTPSRAAARHTHVRKTRSAMRDHTAKNSSDEKPRRSTGPTSPEGKARSSLNRLTHGCRSERTVLPFEDPAEWEFTLQSWIEAYNPQGPTAATLVFEAARAQWIFQRNQQRLDETESGLPPDAIEWTEEHIKRYNNFLRYKTTAERSFYRAFNNLEAHYKRESAKAAAIEKARAQMAKTQMQWLKEKAAASARRKLCARQWVEIVTNSAGECITTFAPTNEELAEMLAFRTQRASEEDDPWPLFVTRFVSFLNGVPPAYEWLCPNDVQRYKSVMGVQQFTHADWLRQIEVETNAGTGHLAPYAIGLLVE